MSECHIPGIFYCSISCVPAAGHASQLCVYRLHWSMIHDIHYCVYRYTLLYIVIEMDNRGEVSQILRTF